MGKAKLKRYQQVVRFKQVIDLSYLRPGDVHEHRGRWRASVFRNQNPIIAELGCGKGDYSLALARRYPDINFVGVDIKGDRLWKAAMRADGEDLPNLRFVRARVDHISQFFGPAELSEIWITFPDPFLKYRRRSRRMTAPNFLERYRQVLAPDGCIHLKTDSPELFEFTLETLEDEGLDEHIKTRIDDIYAAPDAPELLTAIQTYYEKMHLEKGRRIRYLSFTL